jgi:maleamate amidohydrolase
MFPWDGLIPEGDLAAFRAAPAPLDAAPRAGSRPALLLVDMTRMFVDATYPSGCRTGPAAVDASRHILERVRTRGVPVFFTKAYADPEHEPTPAERGLWKHGSLAVPGLPPGDVIVDALAPRSGETVLTKGSKPSAFFGTPLIAMLIAAGVDTLIVAGISTSGCVRATVLDAFQYNLYVIVAFEATADRSSVSHRVSLFDMHMKYASVSSTAAILAYLDQTHAGTAG